MKVVFLLPTVSQVRFQKRVNGLRKLGVEPTILAFQRDYYPGKPWSEEVHSLGTVQHRHLLRRVLTLIRAMPVVRSFAKGSDAVYAFGLDMLLLACLAKLSLAKRVRIVYEAGDIREAMVGWGPVSQMLRQIECHLARRACLIVVTSPAYVTGYYHGMLGLTGLRYQVIENKLHAGQLPPPASARREKPLGAMRIGYFGLIRCQRSLEVLKQLAAMGNGRIHVYIKGTPLGIGDLAAEVSRSPGIEYGGPYVAPDDLPDMYGQVDLAWIAHYHGRTNLAWARANRFYEACYFRVPMVAQVGTVDAQAVESQDLGVCIDLTRLDEAVTAVMGISEAQLARWQQNIAHLPETVYMYSNEHQAVVEAIQSRG
jgi:succinoglycan biosynthesis protein ExoL